MFLFMSALVIAGLAMLLFVATLRKRDFARLLPMIVGVCVGVAAIELAYRQGLGDGSRLTFFPPLLHAQQSKLLLYAAVMAGAAIVAIILAAMFKSAAEDSPQAPTAAAADED